MYDFSLTHGIGPGERNDRHDLAGFGKELERATGLDPWLPHAWPMAAFPEAHTSDGYMPGFGGAVRGFQILAGLDPDGVARSGGPTEKALAATLDPNRRSRPIDADEVYRRAPPETGSIASGHPADGGVKAAAKIRKLSQQTAGPGATGAGKSGSGANPRPPVPTVPPPGVRQSVGAGGVNDRGDLLQARRNLARLGYAPRIRGIGEPDGGLAAVQNGLRAYQQARGLRVDGRMNPGGATEKAVHAQIRVQQKRLKDQAQKDAAEAAAKLSAGGWSGNAGALGGPEGVAARTLGARMTGAKVEAQQREAYAEALDRMKRAGATSSEPEKHAAATAGAQPERPEDNAANDRPGGGHPLMRKQPAHAARRAEARDRAEQEAKDAAAKAAYDADQVKSNGLLRNRIGVNAPSLTPEQKRKLALDVAVESGSLPSASTGWFDDLGQAVERAQARSLSGAGDTAHGAQDRRTLLEGYAYLERVRALVAAKPHNWLGVTPRWRALAGVVASLEKDGAAETDAERVALMVRAGRRLDDLYRKSRGEHLRLVGELIGFVPGPGEALALVQGVDALLDGERAAAAGRTGEAEQHRVQAAILFATAIPGAGRLVRLLHKTAKSLGAKTGRSLTALAERVKKRGQGKDSSKVPVPGPWKIWMEQRLIDVPGLEQDMAQKMLFRIARSRRGLGRNPTVNQVFEGVLPELSKRRQRKIRRKYRRMFGPAGEEHLVWLMKTAGDDSVYRTGRHFEVDGVRFGADAYSTYKYEIVRKNRLAPNFRKPEGTIGDHKGGAGAHLTGPQSKAHGLMKKKKKKERKPAIAVTDKDTQARHVIVARSDFHEYNLRQIEKIIRNDLGIAKFLTPEQMDRVMRNVTELHKASIPPRALKFGSVMAFVMISAAVMAAQNDSGRDDGEGPYPVTP
ncbi:MAG: peptidoglycan-binding domain-containing protein [Rhodospirillaceae bacterium]|nr:peptidoglycan-binding domain-containing protein [Rhodospirillaceae bacterium]